MSNTRHLTPPKPRSRVDQAASAAAFDADEQRHELESYASFEEWSAERVSAGLIDEDPSDWFILKADAFLEGVGMDMKEFPALTAMSDKMVARCLRRNAALAEHRYAVPRPTGGRLTSRSEIAGRLPEVLRAMPETLLNADHGDEYGELDGRHGTRLDMLQPGLRAVGIAAYAIQGSFSPTTRASVILCKLERLDDVFLATGEDPSDPEGVDRALKRYLAEDVFPEDGSTARYEVLRTWFMLPGLLEAYGSGKPDLEAGLAAILPAMPPPNSTLRKDFRLFRTDTAAQCEQNRKDDGAEWLCDNLDDVHAACRIRAHEAVKMSRHSRLAETILLARDAHGTFVHADDSLPFSYRGRALRSDGRRTDRLHRIQMIAHRRGSLFPGRPMDEVVFEFVRVEVDGDDVDQADWSLRHEQWFVELYRRGTLLSATHLPVELKEARRAAILRLQLPPVSERPSSIVGFRGLKDNRDAAAALVRGIVLIPVHSFALGMAFAHLLVRMMTMSLCRVGEALQLAYPPDGWKTDEVNGKRYDLYKATPKGWDRPDHYLIGERTLGFVAAVGRLVKLAEPGGRLLTTEPTRALRDKVGAAKFVFALHGHHFDSDEMNFAFRYLTAGFGRLRSHDIRHGAANRASREQIEELTIARMMRMKGEGLGSVRRYIKKTAKQRNEGSARHMASVEAEELCGIASTAAPAVVSSNSPPANAAAREQEFA